MDKIFSTRIDESVAYRIEDLAKRLRIPKKRVIEEAVLAFAERNEPKGGSDVFEETCGAWKRRESPSKTVEQARKAFRESWEKHRV